ncbi:MAG: AIR carboxylase family protein [Chloroflexota bacterium]
MSISAGNGVIVVMGSPADAPWVDRITSALDAYGIPSETIVASAHKTPKFLLSELERLEASGGSRVYVTVAGRSNALSGFVDAQVTAPVLACPPPSDAFAGMDILSSLRMPRGVAPLVVLEPENAALAAAKILGLVDSEIAERVEAKQAEQRERVMGAGQ